VDTGESLTGKGGGAPALLTGGGGRLGAAPAVVGAVFSEVFTVSVSC